MLARLTIPSTPTGFVAAISHSSTILITPSVGSHMMDEGLPVICSRFLIWEKNLNACWSREGTRVRAHCNLEEDSDGGRTGTDANRMPI